MTGNRTAGGRPRRHQRGSSSTPDDIVDRAIDLARQVGLDQMSMTMLAEHLDVGVSTVYWRFPKREDLLAALAERAWRDYEFPIACTDAGDWRHTLRRHALALRDTLLDHPLLCELVLTRPALCRDAAPATAAAVEQVLANLVAARLSADEACQVYNAVALHVQGWIALRWLQLRRSARDCGQVPTNDQRLEPCLARAQPHDPACRVDLVGTPDDRIFDYGLECILERAGRLVERRYARGGQSAAGVPVQPQPIRY